MSVMLRGRRALTGMPARRRLTVLVVLVLLSRLLLPCLPAQGHTGSDLGSDFYVICTPYGLVDLRSVDPSQGGLGGSGENDGQERLPSDADLFRICTGFCGVSLSVPAPDGAVPTQVWAAGNDRPAPRDGTFAVAAVFHHSLGARAPPALSR